MLKFLTWLMISRLFLLLHTVSFDDLILKIWVACSMWVPKAVILGCYSPLSTCLGKQTLKLASFEEEQRQDCSAIDYKYTTFYVFWFRSRFSTDSMQFVRIEKLKQCSYLKCSYLKMGSHGNALAVSFTGVARACAHVHMIFTTVSRRDMVS